MLSQKQVTERLHNQRDACGGGIVGGGGVLNRGERQARGFGVVADIRDVVSSGINRAAGTKEHHEGVKKLRKSVVVLDYRETVASFLFNVDSHKSYIHMSSPVLMRNSSIV
jgi:hypothetical protein